MAIRIERYDAKISDLKPTEKNPRQISKKDFEALKKSLKNFPEMRELREVVVDENLRILGGHQRVKALRALGEKTAPVKQVFGLTESQKDEFIIRDNIANGDWDTDILANEWEETKLEEWGIDVEKWKDQTEYQDFVDKFLAKAVETYRQTRADIYFLAPVEFLTTKRFHQATTGIGVRIHIPDGRVKFIRGEDSTVAKSPAFGSVIIKLADDTSAELVHIEY